MGYSATANAFKSLERIEKYVQLSTPMAPSNSLPGDIGFYEVGRENADASITGSVFVFTDKSKNLVIRKGSFRIEPSGKISRFYGIPRELIREINKSL